MILEAASIPSNENVQRTINIENVERTSGVQDLRRTSNMQEMHSPPDGSSFPPRIDQSFFQERCQEQQQRRRRRRRRWKLNSCFRCTSATEDEDVPASRDAPPTYSSIFVDPISLREGRSFTFLVDDRSSVIMRIPPPTYAQTQETSLTTSSVDPFVSLSSNRTNDWSRVPVATMCPRCAMLVITVVIVRRSTITHLTALTLFLFGCWPCCLIPYCVDSYSNADHYCPICHTYLGTYAPR